MENIVIPAKLIKGEWRGALIVDNAFQDALVEKNLTLLLNSMVGPFSLPYPEGTEVTVNVSIRLPKKAAEGPGGS